MTGQKRHQEFMIGYQELTQRTGYQITPRIASKHLSESALDLMCDLRAAVEPVPNWSPPPEAEETDVAKRKEK